MSTAPRMAPLGPSGHAFIILSHSPTGSGLPQEECDLEQGDFAAEAALGAARSRLPPDHVVWLSSKSSLEVGPWVVYH